MGLDYIRRLSGKPFLKRWAKGLDRLRLPTFLNVELGREEITITARLVDGIKIETDKTFLVNQKEGGQMAIFDGHKEIARVDGPSKALTEVMSENCGLVPVTLERVSGLGETAEFKIIR